MTYLVDWKVKKIEEFNMFINSAAKLYSIPPALIKATIHEESGGKPSASYKDAVGLMQIITPTSKGLGLEPDRRTDPEMNIMAGTKLLRQNALIFKGRIDLIIFGYYLGPAEATIWIEEQGIDYQADEWKERTIPLPTKNQLTPRAQAWVTDQASPDILISKRIAVYHEYIKKTQWDAAQLF